MAIVQMIPPASGLFNTITANGRTYSTQTGVPIQVPDFDAQILIANGWTALPVAISLAPGLSADLASAISGVDPTYYFQTAVNPAVPSSAVIPCVDGELNYPLGAAAITGEGHMIGVLGRFQNYNTVAVPLCIGTEGKVDNFASGPISIGISLDANLGSNLGTITSWYGCYAQIGSNAGTINAAIFFGGDVNGSTGPINVVYYVFVPTFTAMPAATPVYGFFFNNNPGITTRYAIYVNDAGAPIKTIGQVQTNTLQLDSGIKTATAAAGAATLNKASGKITSEALTTAANTQYFLTLTNSQIAAADTVFASVANGTNSAGIPVVTTVVPGAGSVVIGVIAFGAAFNGTIVISFASLKA